MTLRNWQEEDEVKKLSYSWPAAAGIGLGMFAGMMTVGGYTDVTSAGVSFAAIVVLGVFFEWAFSGRDPGKQAHDFFTPKKLPTNDDLFGWLSFSKKS